MHEHGHHDHIHEHEHDHTHEHAHACGGNCAACSGDPKAELTALMSYMVKHNTAHCAELEGLAKQLKTIGLDQAYEQVMQAVSDFEKGNLRLSTVLASMQEPKEL